MKIKKAFLKLIRKIKRYKIYETFRYDIWRFFGNIFRFRKELYDFHGYDYSYSLSMLRRSLELNRDAILNGYEEEVSRDKKVAKINRAIEILRNVYEDDYISMAEKQLNIELERVPLEEISSGRIHIKNDEVYDLAHKLEKDEWNELWSIIKGNREKGTDMRGWWE